MPIRVPPGRAGRLWLKDRLVVARRAADLLEQKRRALLQEASRLRHLAEDVQARWEAACREAETWYLRAALIGGERQLEVAASYAGEPAEARIVWRSTMGLLYPSEAECRLGPAVDLTGLGDTSALSFAAETNRAALVVAVENAAAAYAVRLVNEELEVTTRRLRAIERRWIPRLETTLHDVERRLEESERETIVQARWARLRTEEVGR